MGRLRGLATLVLGSALALGGLLAAFSLRGEALLLFIRASLAAAYLVVGGIVAAIGWATFRRRPEPAG